MSWRARVRWAGSSRTSAHTWVDRSNSQPTQGQPQSNRCSVKHVGRSDSGCVAESIVPVGVPGGKLERVRAHVQTPPSLLSLPTCPAPPSSPPPPRLYHVALSIPLPTPPPDASPQSPTPPAAAPAGRWLLPAPRATQPAAWPAARHPPPPRVPPPPSPGDTPGGARIVN
jgi:hypothetical protein